IAHDGMKKVLESLQTLRGIISESNLDELLDSEVIDKEKGKEFLVTTGVINKMTASSLWDNSVIITDVPQHFSNAREQWLADGILVSHITDVKDTNFDLSDSTLIWLHLEKYQPEIIKSVYTKFENNQGVAFIQSYYLKEAFRIDGVYSLVLGTPCHFCHIERWLNREEKSFRRNEMSWANLLQLLKKHQMSLPALALSESERGFSQHLIKRRLQELIGTSLVKSHVDTFMSSVSADLITCVLSKEPVIHWQACGCLER
ncbi:McbB family protein, partial [Salmonella enterica]|uniref:McbB family protein n=1 Tax=Salmonella enterica TaxID=28901 RepID=UPI0021B4A835